MRNKRVKSLQVKGIANHETALDISQSSPRRKSGRILRSIDPNISTSHSQDENNGIDSNGVKPRKSIRFTIPTDGMKTARSLLI